MRACNVLSTVSGLWSNGRDSVSGRRRIADRRRASCARAGRRARYLPCLWPQPRQGRRRMGSRRRRARRVARSRAPASCGRQQSRIVAPCRAMTRTTNHRRPGAPPVRRIRSPVRLRLRDFSTVRRQAGAHARPHDRQGGPRPSPAPVCDGWAGSMRSTRRRSHSSQRTAPARDGNTIEVLIDGSEALPRMAGDMAAATSHVHLTGWFLSPELALSREEEPLVVRMLLAELAERVDVRVLLWKGAPIPAFRPSRGDVREMERTLTRHTKIQTRARFVHGGIALPPREDDRDRRPRSRTSAGSTSRSTAAIPTTRRITAPVAASAGTTSRCGSKALPCGTSRSTSGSAGRPRRRRRCRRRPSPSPPATSRSRSCARVPAGTYKALPQGRLLDPRVVPRGAARRPSTSCISRTSSSGRRRSSTSSPTS